MTTAVVGRLKYARQQAVKYADLEQAKKSDRRAINIEIAAKTDFEQKQKRIVAVSGRFVATAATVGLPLSVYVNGSKVAAVEPTAESVATCYGEVKTALLAYLDANLGVSLRIDGRLG